MAAPGHAPATWPPAAQSSRCPRTRWPKRGLSSLKTGRFLAMKKTTLKTSYEARRQERPDRDRLDCGRHGRGRPDRRQPGTDGEVGSDQGRADR